MTRHRIRVRQVPPSWRSQCAVCGEWVSIVTIIPKDAVWDEHGWPEKVTQFYAHDRRKAA